MPRTSRTRKSTIKCSRCDEPAEMGHICNACVEEENRLELLYLSAIAGRPESRKGLKKLTKAQRARIVPSVLTDDDKAAFIEKGVITGRHQSTMHTIKKLFHSDNEEPIVTRTITDKPKTTSTRKRPAGTKAQRTPKPAPKVQAKVESTKPAKAKSSVPTAADIAKEAGIDGRKFRAFLRANKVARTPQAMRAAVKKFKAQAS